MFSTSSEQEQLVDAEPQLADNEEPLVDVEPQLADDEEPLVDVEGQLADVEEQLEPVLVGEPCCTPSATEISTT